MSALDFMKSPWLYVEIEQGSLKVLNGAGDLEFPLERQENGRLTRHCREQLTDRLLGFLNRKPWQPRLRALCAIGARGVSLRRLTLPAASNEDFQRLLRLQIESEFPLPPDQLAWGYRRLERMEGLSSGANSHQELLVVAVKKESIEEYAEIFSECGVRPVFTLRAFTRSRISPQPGGSYAVLDVGLTHSEWTSFQNGAPNSLRILPWGTDNVTRTIAQRLRIAHGEAEQLHNRWMAHTILDEDIAQTVRASVEAELDSLTAAIRSGWTGQKIYVTGIRALDLDLAPRLVARLGKGAACEHWTRAPEDGSAAILGLEQPGDQSTAAPLLIQLDEARDTETVSQSAPWKWAALAVLLVLGLVALPYAEAFLMKSRLSARLAALKVEKQRLPAIDGELRFLQYVKDNQPPYLEALAIVANAAQPGTRFDSVSMNRRGDLALRGFMRDSQQVLDFRSKLINSGFFSTVVVEEQNPTPDRQRVLLRISAQWKSAPGRESLAVAPPVSEIERSKTIGSGVKSNPPPAAPSSTRAAGGTNPPPRSVKE